MRMIVRDSRATYVLLHLLTAAACQISVDELRVIPGSVPEIFLSSSVFQDKGLVDSFRIWVRNIKCPTRILYRVAFPMNEKD